MEVGNHFEVNWHKGASLVKVRIEENLKPYFKVKQINQKIEIGHQKELIEEKQKEIVDSIHYAKRIQSTLFD